MIEPVEDWGLLLSNMMYPFSHNLTLLYTSQLGELMSFSSFNAKEA